MKITAGEYKGRILKTPPGEATRPTADKVRQALFNILGPAIDGAVFLDLYAGSGAAALEALSRGAESATVVESDRRAVQAIEANRVMLGAELEIWPLPVERVLHQLAAAQRRFDFIFLDPPYRFEMAAILALLPPLLNPGATVILEQAAKNERPPNPWGEPKEYKYGDTKLLVWSGIEEGFSADGRR